MTSTSSELQRRRLDAVKAWTAFVEHGAQPEDPYLLDAEVVAANRDAWIEEWTEIVLR